MNGYWMEIRDTEHWGILRWLLKWFSAFICPIPHSSENSHFCLSGIPNTFLYKNVIFFQCSQIYHSFELHIYIYLVCLKKHSLYQVVIFTYFLWVIVFHLIVSFSSIHISNSSRMFWYLQWEKNVTLSKGPADCPNTI